MNLVLTRKKFLEDGIFGELCDENGNHVAVTLEHAFPDSSEFVPKLAVGTYTCRRGQHRLASMLEDFSTFEVMEVPDFQGKPVTGILFHRGNYNRDSEGCVLVGALWAMDMITSSHEAFEQFLTLQNGVDEFNLVVK